MSIQSFFFVVDNVAENICSQGKAPFPGRAHLLPLIRARTTNDSIAFFASYFRPLSERIFERKVNSEDAGRAAEAKVWEVIVAQIWDCFSGFCEIPRDLKEVGSIYHYT